jgi:hypothetical protein
VLGKGAAVVVVSEAFWRDKFGTRGDPLGQTVLIGRTPHSVVGVLGPAFRGLNVQSADAWVPLATYPQPEWMREPWWQSTNQYALRAVARVPASFDEQGFAVRATTAARTLNRSLDGERADTLMTVATGSIIAARGPGAPGQELLISTRLAGGAALLLLIACANAVNLLLVRGVIAAARDRPSHGAGRLTAAAYAPAHRRGVAPGGARDGRCNADRHVGVGTVLRTLAPAGR